MKIWTGIVLCVIFVRSRAEAQDTTPTCPPVTCPPQITCPPQTTSPPNATEDPRNILCSPWPHGITREIFQLEFIPKGCIVNGVIYEVGPMFIDPDDNCLLCSCNRSADGQYPGDVTCERINCTGRPDPPCDTNMLSNQTCCPECMCRYQGKIYHPGPIHNGQFGYKCQGCVCDNGKVNCRWRKAGNHCRLGLMCVDSEFNTDCCRYCPNGLTCMAGNTIIKAGKEVRVGKKVCKCREPWHPNACCTVIKVRNRIKKRNGDQLKYTNLRKGLD